MDQIPLFHSAFSELPLLGRGKVRAIDFYSGIIMRAIGIPTEMFTVIFAIGRMPGWIANFKEILEEPKTRIYRPRQIYTGNTVNHYTRLEERR